MRIKHYPGKAVQDDPTWLEMDVPPSTRGRQYEANWEEPRLKETAKTSWDSGSVRGTSKLGHYQNLLQEIVEQSTAKTEVNSVTGSVRLKYHSDKCLARINSKNKRDYEEKVHRFFADPKENGRIPKLTQEHAKKSVRFNDKSVEIGTIPWFKPPAEQEEPPEDPERVSQWIDEQNKYILTIPDEEPKEILLTRNDSGYYEHNKKIRQRLPPKNICRNSPELSESSLTSLEDYPHKSDSFTSNSSDDDNVYSLYKNGR